jgi:hypothetical protein
MVEIWAAMAAAAVTTAAAAVFGFTRKHEEGRDAVIRLTTAVEHIATQLEVLHVDMKEDRRETFSRISGVEQRISKLEARPNCQI